MSVRAKFLVERVTSHAGGGKTVNLRPVHTGEENKSFWQATPSGQMEMFINNPKASEFFTPGDEYYIDFTRVGTGNSL